MTTTLVDSIGQLVTHDAERPHRDNAALVIENGLVAWVGDAADAPAADERVDAAGGTVIPGYVDS
ncbi:MAG: imidazolonepropionase, partial [Rhodoglobus sp.]